MAELMVITGHRGLQLPGWDRYSIWGVDPVWGTLFAQLWRNPADGAPLPEEPEAWIMPTRLFITSLQDLAREIAKRAGVSEDEAAMAIARSLGRAAALA
jgi:hypothetical protein